MKILLIGGSGRLGTAFRRLLAGAHGIVSPAEGSFDATDREAVRAELGEAKPDWLVNFAAYNNVDGAEGEGAGAAMRVNAYLPAVLASEAADAGVRFLHMSTDYVFRGDRKEGYVEDDAPAPVSAYGVSKYLGELAARACHPRAFVVRTSRLYGAQAEMEASKPSFVEIIQAQAAREKSFAVNDGEVSAPTLVDDLVRHMDAHVISKPDAAPGVYHMVNEGGCTWYEWAKAVVELSGLDSEVRPRDPAEMKRAAKRPEFSMLKSTKLPPMRPWREALAAFLRRADI